nr:ATP synthase F0 subunit 6 [Potamalpheops sp. purple zebra]
MMTNLFSSFDPLSSSFNLPLNWLSTFLGLMLIPFLFWAIPSRWSLLWSNLTSTLHKEFKTKISGIKSSKNYCFRIDFFTSSLFNNFMGLIPYIFTSTSHLAFTLTLSLPLWLSFMLFGWINHTQHMFAHLVPAGTPGPLMPLMVLIETISNVIRPGTLAVRLAANMIAGHLLLTLLGNTGTSLQYSLLSILLVAQILLLILESAVAVIQSYVFAALSTLYAGEVN